MPTSAALATSQINARIDADLKKRGDAALAKASLTPTQAVRALWQLASNYASRPNELRELLLPDEAAQKAAKEAERRGRMVALAQEGANLWDEYFPYSDASLATDAPLSYAELKEATYAERYGSAAMFDE